MSNQKTKIKEIKRIFFELGCRTDDYEHVIFLKNSYQMLDFFRLYDVNSAQPLSDVRVSKTKIRGTSWLNDIEKIKSSKW